MANLKHCGFFLGLICLLALSACGGSSTTAAPADTAAAFNAWAAQQHSAPAAPAVDASGLPAFPAESGPRGVSASGGSQTVLGADYIIEKYAQVDGTGLIIGPTPDTAGEDTAYGMYSFTGLSGQHLVALTVSAQPSELKMGYYVALADFTKLQWVWFGPVTLPEFKFDFGQRDSQFISPLGNVYFVVATHAANVVTHNFSVLTYDANGGGGKDPGAPTDLVASDGTFADGVGLTWNAGEGAQWYEVYRYAGQNSGAQEWQRLDVTKVPKYFDSNVVAGQVYKYRVRSVAADPDGAERYSAYSNIDSGYSAGGGNTGGPGVPKGLTASDGAYPDQIVVKWQSAPGDQAFRLYRYMEQSTQPGWTLVAETKDPYFYDTAVTPQLLYDYKVQGVAFDANGGATYSDFSNIDSGYAGSTDTGGDPGVPQNLTASDGAYPTQIVVKWTPAAGDQWFRLWRRPTAANTPDWQVVAEPKDAYFYDTSVVPGTLYDYKVQGAAARADGSIAYSADSNIDSGFAGGNGNGGGNGGPDKP